MKPLLIGIAGGSGSGKSTVARNVAAALGTASVAFIDMDAYYHGASHLSVEERRKINFDHPNAAHFAQETRVVAQAMGHKPGAKYKYSAPPVYLFEPHQPEQCNYKPDLILKIDEVWEQKYKAFQILAAQKHLWGYYERVALNRGIQGSRNTGVPMTYGEAYQTLFPRVTETLG